MASERSIRRYRGWYAQLLRLHSKAHRERFGDGMEQTFHDLCRERREEKKGVFGLVLWVFAETSVRIMKENTMRKGSILRVALGTALILLVPAVAMQFSDGMAWGPMDFVLAGALLFGSGLAYQVITGKTGSLAYRAAVGIALAAAFILIWANLAVGLIGSEGNPANLMYIGVLAVGITGVVLARLEPRGMARALFGTALAQALVAVVALAAGLGASGQELAKILILNGIFVALFAGSALLFRRAAAAGR